MFDGMPAPDGRPFPSPPVQLVTFQIEFEEERPLRSRDGITWKKQFEERGYRVPRLAPVRQRTINVQIPSLGNPGDQTLVAERGGWQVFIEDSLSNFALFSTALNIERANYPGYDRFRKEILDAYEAAAHILEPKVQSRVLLSYANALSSPDAMSVGYWRGRVCNHFLGAPSDERITANFSRSLSVFSFEEGDYGADLKVAIQPDQVHKGAIAFVFQTEIARKGIREISQPEMTQTIETMHTIALKMFYAVLEPDYVQSLRKNTVVNA